MIVDKRTTAAHLQLNDWYCFRCGKDFDTEEDEKEHDCEDLKDDTE